jgi:hypothetical protein
MKIDINYFKYKMSVYEAQCALDAYYKDVKKHLEEIRLIGFFIFQSQSIKPLKLTDIHRFDWENEKEIITISDEIKNVCKAKKEEVINQLNIENTP